MKFSNFLFFSWEGFYSGVKHLPGIELPGGNLGLAMKGKIVGEVARWGELTSLTSWFL